MAVAREQQLSEDEFEVVDDRLPGLPMTYKRTHRWQPRGITVFMPAAFVGDRAERAPQTTSRFRWRDLVPQQEVLAFADPALLQHPDLRGAWYIHPEVDVIHAFAEVVREVAAELGLPLWRTTIHGSSLGGFGAIALASCLPGARALAEVPQVDFAGWYAGPVSDVERHVMHMGVEEYRTLHPEQVNVVSRMVKERFVPPITIFTNPTDKQYEEQLKLFRWVPGARLPGAGEANLLLTTLTTGHQVLSREQAARLVNWNALLDLDTSPFPL